MASEIRWCEIGPYPSTERFNSLSQALTESGCPNSYSFIEADKANFPKIFEQAKRDFHQIRLGGDLCQEICRISRHLPSGLVTIRSADSVVCANQGGKLDWWPRNFLANGVSHTMAKGIKNLDFSGGVFILGTNALARAAVSALARIGFSRFAISDHDEQRGLALIEELKAAYFKIQFQFVPRHLVTQLPGVYSFAVNTLEQGRDDGTLGELVYFNFLKTGGVWLDLAFLPINTALDVEAHTVGAFVQPGISVFSYADCSWAETCFKIDFNLKRLTELFTEVRGASAPTTPN
jgi:hypothetical protein